MVAWVQEEEEEEPVGRTSTLETTPEPATPCGARRMKPPELVLASVTLSTRLDLGSHATRSIVTATLGMGPRKSWKAEAWMLIWLGSQVGHES